ncbi:hypothetical protein ACFV9C_44615 [Kribbella sp. NPDC059898]|uniref:hypothetical protein n=1 Tax=Kribbella sp. NPDC059898 TaxID=3346995 RepID=UPI00364ADB9E
MAQDGQNVGLSEKIPLPDISTIADRATWVADAEDPSWLTHPGIPGWALAERPGKVGVYGVLEGIPEEPVVTVPTFEAAVALIAYMHGH